MHLMQYEIALPADYDMAIIDNRVATRGHGTDDFPHLGVKAYAVRRIGRHGSAVNVYAPFYFWTDPAGMTAFLSGPFRAIITDFGRPRVRHWVGAGFRRGPGFGRTPAFATRHTRPATEQTRGPELDATVHSEAIGLDPDRWELVRFTLWTAVPDRLDPAATAFDILHTSAPEAATL
jgi:hypothetical protein